MIVSSIQEYLRQILQAVYGKDVRKAIHDAINQCYIDASAGITPVITTESVTGGTQVNITVGDNTTSFVVQNGEATDTQVETYISEWLDDHPEATTTVQDGSITVAKLATDTTNLIASKANTDDLDEIDDKTTFITGVIQLEFADGYIDIPSVGSTCNLTRTSFSDRKSTYAEISDDDSITINVIGVGTTSAGGRAWAFLDESYKVISRAESNVTVDGALVVPIGAKYVVINTRTDTISDYYAYVGIVNQSGTLKTASKNAKNALDIIDSIADMESINLAELNVIKYWIDTTNNVIDSSASQPARLVVIPMQPNMTLSVSIPLTSTKRIAFCNSVTDQSPAYNAQEIQGSLNAVFTNSNYKYFVIQLFLNSDTDKDYTHYLDTADISIVTAMDTVVRKSVNDLLNSGGTFFHTENLSGIPILDSFDDIEIVTSAYDNAVNFHNLVKTELCDTSNGYLVQTLLGDDGHGNNLYKYVTYPETVRYGANRRFGTPDYPIAGGFLTDLFTVIVTTNIHGIEHGSNWVIYNLLKKMFTENSDMIRFFKKRVKLIWIPYICVSGDYENADGININRDFPTTKDGTCVSAEANLVKSVIDEYGDSADLHIDIHTFATTGSYAQYFASWAFTDSDKLGMKSVIVADSVCNRYSAKYPDIDLLKKDVVSAINTPTTCTYYTQTVYGVPSGTIEGALSMDGSPIDADSHTSATAYLYDIITQTICAMV